MGENGFETTVNVIDILKFFEDDAYPIFKNENFGHKQLGFSVQYIEHISCKYHWV